MKASARIFVILIWLGALILAGSILLELTAARVGEHKSSTYGFAYFQFQEGWGREIGIIPPEFMLQRNYTVSEYNNAAEQYEPVVRLPGRRRVPVPVDRGLLVDLHHANFPGSALRGFDLPDLHVTDGVHQPLGHFQVANFTECRIVRSLRA